MLGLFYRPTYTPVHRSLEFHYSGYLERSPGTFDSLWTLYNRGLLTEYSSRWIEITTGGDYTLESGLELEVKGSARTSLDGNLPDGSIIRVWATTLNEYYDALADPVTGRLALKLTIDGVACTFTLINMVEPTVFGPTWDDSGTWDDSLNWTE